MLVRTRYVLVHTRKKYKPVHTATYYNIPLTAGAVSPLVQTWRAQKAESKPSVALCVSCSCLSSSLALAASSGRPTRSLCRVTKPLHSLSTKPSINLLIASSIYSASGLASKYSSSSRQGSKSSSSSPLSCIGGCCNMAWTTKSCFRIS